VATCALPEVRAGGALDGGGRSPTEPGWQEFVASERIDKPLQCADSFLAGLSDEHNEGRSLA
jgi:hypothetical protein